MRRGFVNHEFLNALLLFSLATIFILGGPLERVLIGCLVVGFALFAYWFEWKVTLRPGNRVRVTRGEYKGLEGIVHPEHLSQHRASVRVISARDGKRVTYEFSQHDVEKV